MKELAEVVPGAVDIPAVARAQREKNVRIISLALTVLTALAALLSWTLTPSPLLGGFLMLSASGMAGSYLLAARGRLGPAVFLLVACVFVEHIGAVYLSKVLGPTPFVASVVILIVAATMPARYLSAAFVGCLVTIGIEGASVPWSVENQGIMGTAALLSGLAFVVSLLHVRGVERAFALASEQSQAREAASREALENAERFRLIADTAEDLIALIRPSGEAVFMSQSHERVVGVPVAQLSQGLFSDHLRVENLDESRAATKKAFLEGRGRLELRVVRPDGSRLILDVRMRRIDSESGGLMALISRDITQQRALETRLHASERVEALGRLAGSVAHDFNNLLTVIQGSAENAKAILPAQSVVREDLDAVLSASATAADLSRQLLTFSRRQLVVRSPTDVSAILADQRDILSRLLGRQVQVEYSLGPNLPRVIIPKAHVEQLCMNLVSNARDAMPHGGQVRIATALRALRDREVEDLVAGEYIQITVDDSGEGISEEVLPHLFEPFFSTKGGLGTGLGLATCHAITAQAGGAIMVRSRLGVGTTFQVLLPAVYDSRSPPEESVPMSEVRCVLVVDDDENVRDLVSRMLRADGFEVVAASSVGQALAILEDAQVELDALLTDIVLGQERGTDLLVPGRVARPELRMVVISGYAPEPEVADALAKSGSSFLAKPFGRDQLRAALGRGPRKHSSR